MMPSLSCLQNTKIDSSLHELLKDDHFYWPQKDLQNNARRFQDRLIDTSLISVGTIGFHCLLISVFLWTAVHTEKKSTEKPPQIIEINMVTSAEEKPDEQPVEQITEQNPPVTETRPVEPPVAEPEPIPEISPPPPETIPEPIPIVKQPDPVKPKEVVRPKKVVEKKPVVQKPRPIINKPVIDAEPVKQPVMSSVPKDSGESAVTSPEKITDSANTQNTNPSKPSKSVGMLHNPRPTYPSSARRRGDEGTVYVRLLIGKNGDVVSVDLHKSSGFPTLDDAALQGVKSWRFSPAVKDGEAIQKSVVLPVRFKLEEGD